jgi:hypothetical protein
MHTRREIDHILDDIIELIAQKNRQVKKREKAKKLYSIIYARQSTSRQITASEPRVCGQRVPNLLIIK